MELLAPAGSYKALIAAVQSGADAVYVGGSRFSARGTADNFDDESLIKWVNYCHLRGVKVHVAANTLIKDNETDDFLNYIGFLNKIGVDAVIMQDLGMAYASKQMYPDLELHASTQITCASLDTALMLKEIGFSRIVLSRELDKTLIEKIKKYSGCEIEVFVHGAICMSYSGQCLMSSMIGNRSGNRGYCAQPCRLPYTFENNGNNILSGYLLSPKDMCLASHLALLENIGVDSLKIEGRLKRSEYVGTVVGVYRELLDKNTKPDKQMIKTLLDAFNRSGFTDGYFTGQLGKSMMTYNTPSNISDNMFSKDAVLRCEETTNLKKIPITFDAQLKIGMPFTMTVSDGVNTVTERSKALGEYANKVAISKERVVSQIEKLGNTPFYAENVYVDLEDNVTIAVSEINNVRRIAVEKLSDARIMPKAKTQKEIEFEIENKPVDEVMLSAKVTTIPQANACIKSGIKRIYAPFKVLKELKEENVETISLLPPILKEGKESKDKISEKIMASSLGQTREILKKNCSFDFRMNITNSYTMQLLKDCDSATLSVELSLNEIRAMKKPCNTEIVVYGKIPLMTFENCPVKAVGKCSKGKDTNKLIDRKNMEFLLKCTEGCFCELLNSKPIFMADKLNELKESGVKYMRLDFTDENEDDCIRIINEYKDALNGGKVEKWMDNTFTRGHFYKSVL